MSIPRDIRREGWVRNRERKRWPQPGGFWCWGCDRNETNDCRKCCVCGYRDRHRTRRNKKGG